MIWPLSMCSVSMRYKSSYIHRITLYVRMVHYMMAGAQYQINCNNVVISNLLDMTSITPQKGLTTQWLSTVGQFYRGKFHLFVTHYFLSVCKHYTGKQKYVKRHLYKQWIPSHVRTYVCTHTVPYYLAIILRQWQSHLVEVDFNLIYCSISESEQYM